MEDEQSIPQQITPSTITTPLTDGLVQTENGKQVVAQSLPPPEQTKHNPSETNPETTVNLEKTPQEAVGLYRTSAALPDDLPIQTILADKHVVHRIFGAFTNISSEYFGTAFNIIRSPKTFATSIGKTKVMPAWMFYTSSVGILVFVWFVTSEMRRGGAPQTLLAFIAILLGIMSANCFALALRLLGSKAEFRLLRDLYFYAFGTYSIIDLISVEIVKTALCYSMWNTPTPDALERSADNLMALKGLSHLADSIDKTAMLLFSFAGLYVLYILTRWSTHERLPRFIGALCALFAINWASNNYILFPIQQYLQASGRFN